MVNPLVAATAAAAARFSVVEVCGPFAADAGCAEASDSSSAVQSAAIIAKTSSSRVRRRAPPRARSKSVIYRLPFSGGKGTFSAWSASGRGRDQNTRHGQHGEGEARLRRDRVDEGANGGAVALQQHRHVEPVPH